MTTTFTLGQIYPILKRPDRKMQRHPEIKICRNGKVICSNFDPQKFPELCDCTVTGIYTDTVLSTGLYSSWSHAVQYVSI